MRCFQKSENYYWSFCNQHTIYLVLVFVLTYPVESCKITVILFDSMLSNLRIILVFVLTTLLNVAKLQLHLSLALCC